MALFKNRFGRDIDLAELRHAYRAVFNTEQATKRVLPDLAVFCHANEPAPPQGDLFLQGRAAGRRDLWLHLNEFLHLTEEDLTDLYRGRAIKIGG